MGITFNIIEKMNELHLLTPGMKIMDIGTSNLYQAPADGIINLLSKFVTQTDDIEDYARALEEGAYYDPVLGGRNGSWAGDFFEKCGFEYYSLDIAKGYKTTVFDLNSDKIPDNWNNMFDLVLNFGTSEHIFNQLHVFTLIHDMTRKGGFMMHQLPISGHADHGYFSYTTRFFTDIAYRNGYEIYYVDYGKGGKSNVFNLAKNMPKYHTAFNSCSFDETLIHDISITIVLKKINDCKFICSQELTTSVVI